MAQEFRIWVRLCQIKPGHMFFFFFLAEEFALQSKS